jgi:hypothetical protein
MLKLLSPVLAAALALGVLVTTTPASADRPKKEAKPKVTKKAKEVPEINGTHAGVGLALVLGGVAVVLGRRRRAVA